ncbi:MAG: hypothetical protein M1353_01325 [Nitrospirae bacterium]|nr:hypothetical protein [Nitrospirota bacterium]
MRYWGGFPEYVPVARKKEKAAKKLKELMKKNPDMKPVALEGSALARTWWGKAWNRNLERYADYSNRIGRGRSYVRHGAVLDLQIDSCEIRALVQGSAPKPYSVIIKITALKKNVRQEITAACEGMLESLQGLLAGEFPKTLGEIFTAKDSGLFPSPKEIKFSCSCPDWASMCKHVAAALYGAGTRLDEDPKLFFQLRNIGMGELIKQTVAGQTEKLLARAAKKSSRIIGESDLSSVFGIDMETPDTAASPAAKKKIKAGASSGQDETAQKPDGRKRSANKGKKKVAPKAPSKNAEEKGESVKKKTGARKAGGHTGKTAIQS